VLDRLIAAGVNTEEPGARTSVADARPVADAGAGDGSGQPADGLEQTLRGRSVVVTGTIDGYTREQAEEAILLRGGKSPGSVSKRTYVVVVGSEPGSAKLSKAESVGVPIIGGELFEQLLRTGELPS